jgi:hypothetical protein
MKIMEQVKNTLFPLKVLTKAQRLLYAETLESTYGHLKVFGHRLKHARALEHLGLIKTELTEDNRLLAKVPRNIFFVKIDSGKLDWTCDKMCRTEILIAPDFYTAFHYAHQKWVNLFLGIELCDPLDPG